MDTLGIKENARSAGMSKNYKKEREDWTPMELEIDDSMKVDYVPADGTDPAHFECSIPWKNGTPSLRNNLAAVLARQKNTNYGGYLEKKGTTLPEMDAKFLEQLLKGYIEEVIGDADINDPKAYYLNYFPVVNRNKETTKVRIVFDAASKDKYGKSLNSEIAKGPNRLNDLYPILLRFRQHRYAIQADISEMFLRCRLKKEDRRYHRFYWNGKIWQWTRTLFGNRASPDLSQKVIVTNAERHEKEFPLAAACSKNDLYMDDAIKSLELESDCVSLATELIPLFQRADMKIMKFYTNSRMAIQSLPADCLSEKVHVMEDQDAEYESSKVLGMVWDASKDTLKFIAKFQNAEEFFLSQKLARNPTWTKRLILRLSATVYDPTGIICPFTVRSRAILQELWRNKSLEWDTPIPEEDSKKWSKWLEDLFLLADLIEIPRFLEFQSDRDAEIHVFVDASTKAFATCAYVRITQKVTRETAREEKESTREAIAVRLITARARVTPNKVESVSKLELASCCMGSRLGNGIARAFDIHPDKVRYWTDSTNCMYWINSESSALKIFVANRVGEIQNDTKIENWRHVPTDQNPADIPTRFPEVADLSQNSLWWNGPAFLMKPEADWPEKFKAPLDDEGKEEFKKQFQMLHTLNVATPAKKKVSFQLPAPTRPKAERILAENYSIGRFCNGLQYLINRTATIFEIVHSSKKEKQTRQQYVNKSIMYHLKRSQREDAELKLMMQQLSEGSPKVRNSALFPFLDEFGVLRHESRLVEITHLPYHTKYPVILNAKSHFVKLLVQSAHIAYEHTVGIQNAKAKLKNSYFILGLERCLQQVRAECLFCKKKRAKPYEQRMAHLPAYRFEQPLRAFAKTGLDFAGPYEIKVGRCKTRPKIYILVFTCLQVRAVHLEVTESMDTRAFTNALTRFVAIRGMPTDILSDNWKTFISDDKELEGWVQKLDQDAIMADAPANVQWHLTPPHGPHHGGTYEIMVKAAKRALKALFHRPDLDMDEFRTAIAKITSLLNNRPLTRTEVDGRQMILTPNHFLLGHLGGAVTIERIGRVERRWEIVHKLVKIFWTSFLADYVAELKQARKWKSIRNNVNVGDLVLEVDPNAAQGTWKIAVVRQVFPSVDGLVRKVEIENNKNTYIRPITVLCPLDVNIEP